MVPVQMPVVLALVARVVLLLVVVQIPVALRAAMALLAAVAEIPVALVVPLAGRDTVLVQMALMLPALLVLSAAASSYLLGHRRFRGLSIL